MSSQTEDKPQKIMSKADRRRERQNHRPMTPAERQNYRDELRALRKEQRIMKSTGKKMKWQHYCATKRARGEDINDEDHSTFFRVPGQILEQLDRTTAEHLEPSKKKIRLDDKNHGHTYTMLINNSACNNTANYSDAAMAVQPPKTLGSPATRMMKRQAVAKSKAAKKTIAQKFDPAQ